MLKRLSGVLVLCCLLLLPIWALATEGAEDAFVSPTRDPNAPEYKTEHPEELVPSQIVANSYILYERKSEAVIDERDADLRRFPASTTKIMTALIALQVGNLDDTLEITANAVTLPEDASKVPFKQGEIVTLRDALYGLLLRSGNEAAIAIAEHIGGDVHTFVAMMNETAAILGCTNTNFTNPHGYHDELHQTTARDLAIIMDAALQNETFREIIRTSNWELTATDKNPARNIVNSNLHIREGDNYFYEFSIGGKTGFTNDAGYCLVEAAEKDGVELIAVALYSGKYSRWPDTSRLFQYGFTKFKSVTPEQIYQMNPTTLQINGFAQDDRNLGRLQLALRPVDANRDVSFTDIKEKIDMILENYGEYTNITWVEEPRAPITAGQVMGTMTFFPQDEEPAEYQLVATRSIAARTDAPLTLEEIEAMVAADPSPFPPFGWDWVLPPVLGAIAVVALIGFAVRALHRRRRKRKAVPSAKRRTYN